MAKLLWINITKQRGSTGTRKGQNIPKGRIGNIKHWLDKHQRRGK